MLPVFSVVIFLQVKFLPDRAESQCWQVFVGIIA